MQNALNQLIQLLTLKKLSQTQFQGESEDLGFPQVFGGQVVAQGLSAGMQTVDLSQYLHSCHAYFLHAGDAKQPIIYDVETMRTGKFFTMLSVTASQQAVPICRIMMSFHTAEAGFNHQNKMPDVGLPEHFFSEAQLMQNLAPYLPSPLKETFTKPRAFDVRVKYVNDPFKGKRLPPEQYVWLRANALVADNQRLQQCLLAYFSDFHCLITALHPHEKGFMQQGVKIASLDHSIWFHRSLNLNDWLLYALDSPNLHASRGLSRGQFFNQQGELVASIAQEGLVRYTP